MTTVKITWQAFGPSASATIDGLEWFASHRALCDWLFRDTNRYEGALWDLIEPVLPANRSHTALSIGDLVEIDGIVYRCEPVGWLQLETV